MTKRECLNYTDMIPKFLCDRMLGNLTRYLRFLGYDTVSATILPEGDPKEDSVLICMAEKDERFLLTGDKELAQRAGKRCILIHPGPVQEQIQTLKTLHIITDFFQFTRCSLCNAELIPLPDTESNQTIIPNNISPHDCTYCTQCNKIYWKGSHTDHLISLFEDMHLL